MTKASVANDRASSSSKRNAQGSIEHGSSVRIAFQEIRDLIVHGKLAPGSWIIEAELSNKLGLSRTPIRAALQALQKEGYVASLGTGTKSRMLVAPLTREDAEELYAIVGHIEGLAGRLTASMAKEERSALVSKLKKLNVQLASTSKKGRIEPNHFFDIDTQFHDLIVEASAGPRLRNLYMAIKPQVERYWRLYSSSITGDLKSSVQEHDVIIDAISRGDEDETERGLQVNWENGAERLATVIATHGERGSW
jgi:DNA-binding GntR family transcriptional regulator